MSGEGPDAPTPASVYLVLVVCAAVSVGLSWPLAMQLPEANRPGHLFGIGVAALGFPLLSGAISRKLGNRAGPAIVVVALMFVMTRVLEWKPSSEVSQARAELAASVDELAEKRAAGDRAATGERVVAAAEKAMIAEGKMRPDGAGVLTRVQRDLEDHAKRHAGHVDALVEAGGCESRGLTSLAALEARQALITSARGSAEATGAFLRTFVADAERELRAAGVVESEIEGFRRGYEAGGKFRIIGDLCSAQARQFTACEALFVVLREQFGRWSDGADKVVFADDAPDAAVAAYNAASATINAEVVTLAELQQKLTGAEPAK